tara:strand:+ start:505 stop:873 length:369 start_codon:yes stop_codon:yes gene_type:complete
MATYKTSISGSISDAKWTDDAATATEVEASSSSINVDQVRIDNTANSTKLYLKLYNLAASSLTVGSNSPESILCVEAGSSVEYSFEPGMAFGTALCYAVVTTGGTAGVTAPATAITVEILTS